MNERRRRARCPHPGKDHYRYEGEAKRAEANANGTYDASRGAVHRYQCDGCGHWHLTRTRAR